MVWLEIRLKIDYFEHKIKKLLNMSDFQWVRSVGRFVGKLAAAVSWYQISSVFSLIALPHGHGNAYSPPHWQSSDPLGMSVNTHTHTKHSRNLYKFHTNTFVQSVYFLSSAYLTHFQTCFHDVHTVNSPSLIITISSPTYLMVCWSQSHCTHQLRFSTNKGVLSHQVL